MTEKDWRMLAKLLRIEAGAAAMIPDALPMQLLSYFVNVAKKMADYEAGKEKGDE